MVLAIGYPSDRVDKTHRVMKIGKAKFALDFTPVVTDRPARQQVEQFRRCDFIECMFRTFSRLAVKVSQFVESHKYNTAPQARAAIMP